jgi:hypothetical protein
MYTSPRLMTTVPNFVRMWRVGMPAYEEPKKIEPNGLGDYLEVMSKSVFRGG